MYRTHCAHTQTVRCEPMSQSALINSRNPMYVRLVLFSLFYTVALTNSFTDIDLYHSVTMIMLYPVCSADIAHFPLLIVTTKLILISLNWNILDFEYFFSRYYLSHFSLPGFIHTLIVRCTLMVMVH